MSRRSLVLRPWTTKETLCLFLCSLLVLDSHLFAQELDTAGSTTSSTIITGRPFSAIKFTRKIHIEKDGTAVTIAERSHALVARNADGQVFMADSAGSVNEPCDLPGMGTLPVCTIWRVLIFDPNEGVMWHWVDGAQADERQYVEVKLSGDQIEDAERLTSAISIPRTDQPEPSVSTQDLGEQDIQGIPARGVRTITLHNDTKGVQKVMVHEVWTSDQMGLVLKVVDGDPEGDETISGLDHISLAPSRVLFQLPSERILHNWKNNSNYADDDVARLANWLVR